MHKASNEAVRIVDKKIAEKVSEAEETINKAVNQFIENVCSEKINKIQIPEKKSNWSDEVTYYSMSEYVGKKFEEFLTERRYTREGKLGSYSSERQLSAADLLTTKYLELEFGTKIEEMIQNAKHEVEIDIVKSLEQKLKENLTKETIEKMNIPEVLKKLESGSLGLVEQKEC